MRNPQQLWQTAKLILAVVITCAVAVLWSHRGPAIDSPAHAQYAPRPTLDRTNGADAAIMVARDIVLKRYEATNFNWNADDAVDKTAEEVSRVAGLIIRSYRPYAVPDRGDAREPRLRVIPPEEAQQP